ncbi:MAG: 3-dehydroquinate synthase [Allomuricauda sp.]|nr:MAG: 3-dehydroquinate synthase [Allomuricauda sp.]
MEHLPSIAQSFQVNYEYRLYFTEAVFSVHNPLLEQLIGKDSIDGAVKALFVVDSGVYMKHPNMLKDIENYCHTKTGIELTDIVLVPGGEACKNDPKVVENILAAINEKSICRHSFVVAIGGGSVIDAAGYAATIAHRGVKLIRIPTTVLSQNDAAVGVKNGINAFGKKNFVGTFSLPDAIINDSKFLETLEQRDWIAGIAEAVKVALLKDGEFFDFIVQNTKKLASRDKGIMNNLIFRCAEIHMQHIAQNGDPFEKGSSRPLDFGHWSAHKLEQMTNYALRHGEAVAMGIALDVTYANLIGLIDDDLLNQILLAFEEIGFDLELPIKNDAAVDQLMLGVEEFREHLGGQLTITLIAGIGKKHDVHEIDAKKMRKAIALRSIEKSTLSC